MSKAATDPTTPPKSWRDVIPVHPAADLFPIMPPDELKTLGEDIKTNGLTHQIVFWTPDSDYWKWSESDRKRKLRRGELDLLEGRNRVAALVSLGRIGLDDDGSPDITWPPACDAYEPHIFGPEVDPYLYVLSANLYRRHLTAEQKREIIAKLLKAQPEKSNRTIANQTNVDHKTVGAVRERLASTGEIPQLDKTVGADGKARVADKKATQQEKAVRRAAREAELAARITALPDKKYGVIYADPPWRFEPYSRDTGMDRAADNHYPTSTTDEIAALPVPAIAADDAVCFLWATAPMIEDALVAMRAWGFEYKSQIVWDKEIAGTGYWFRNQHEHLLVGTRGKVPAPAEGTQWPSVIRALRRAHSEKPESALELIEAYFPTLPKIELYGRGEARLGWEAWGNEVVPPLPAAPVPDTEFRYVPHEAVEKFLAEGWVATEGLTGTHHGDYAVLMQRPARQTDAPEEMTDGLRHTPAS